MPPLRDRSPRPSFGATRSWTEDRAALESDASADPEAGMAGERKRSPPPAGRKPSWHQSEKLRSLGQSPRTCTSALQPGPATSPCRLRGIGYLVCLYTQVSYPAPLPRPAERTNQVGGESAKPARKRRQKIAGKDRGALQFAASNGLAWLDLAHISRILCRRPLSYGP